MAGSFVTARQQALRDVVEAYRPALESLDGFDAVMVTVSEEFSRRTRREEGLALWLQPVPDDMVIRVMFRTRRAARRAEVRVREILAGLPCDVTSSGAAVEDFAPCEVDERWSTRRLDRLRDTVDTPRADWVVLGDNATYSGYKLHVYGEGIEDVVDIVSRVGDVALRRGIGFKVAPRGLFEKSVPAPVGDESIDRRARESFARLKIQQMKAVTLYLPRLASAGEDAAAVVAAMKGYRHATPIPLDTYLANGVSWRFDFYDYPGRDLTHFEAHHRYRSASAPAIDVPPLTLSGLDRRARQLG